MAEAPGRFACRRPGPPLSDLVDFFWIYEGYSADHNGEWLLPTGTMELVFTLDADGRLASGISGARSEAAMIDTSRPFSAIAVHFRPGGGFPFFGVPASELRNAVLTLDLLWGSNAGAVCHRLWEAKSSEERFRVLERALLARANRPLARHRAVRYALEAVDRSSGAQRIDDLVARIGLSARRFAELFQSEVGLSPKTFCRIRRFNEALKRVDGLTDVDWTDVAISCGYFDQPHFNHDFRALTGLTPTDYLRDRVSRLHVALY